MRDDAQPRRVYRDGKAMDHYDAVADVVPREHWGARHSRGAVSTTPKPLVILHHAASPDIACGVTQQREREAVRGIEDFHANTRGWAGIGYNFLVFQSGRIYEGRGWDRAGAHTKGKNSSSVGICLVMDADSRHPTEAAVEAVRDLIATGVRTGHIAQGYQLKGHRDFADTSCPGQNVYAKLGTFRPVVP